ncbi:MAG: alpha/beta fold hydrolase [Pseudomonadota bacterium]
MWGVTVRLVFVLAVMALVGLCRQVSAEGVAQPPIEAYGERAVVRSMSMSPSGDQLAFILRLEGRDILMTHSVEEGLKPRIDLTDLQGNWIWFATEDHIVIRGYRRMNVWGYRGEFDFTAAISYNLETGKTKQLLRKAEELYPAQSGLGRIVGRLDETNEMLMPAYIGRTDRDIAKAVFRADLRTGRGHTVVTGPEHTIGWFFSPDGMLLGRENMDDDESTYAIHTMVGDKRRKIFEQKGVDRPPFEILGVKSDYSGLVLSVKDYDSEHAFLEMDFDGHMQPVSLGDSIRSIADVIRDNNQIIHGIEYAGLQPSYQFFDPDIDARFQAAMAQLKGTTVHLVDFNDDWSKILLHIFGAGTAGQYVLLNTETGSLSAVTQARPGIPPEAVGDVSSIEYEARDGQKISAIVTWPVGNTMQTRHQLPTIVMPHGGPRSHDQVDFYWMAQFFASRGYLVVQPNFRGSTGFGAEFMLAGNGEWGGKMQDDVSDGLDALVQAGYTDPRRTCIVGWSYGGYAALAGGAFTPDLYQCVVAIAPVSDLRQLFTDEAREHGRNHYILSYWREMIGDPKADKARMEATSPINFANQFTAPVLLIHGKDDDVVDYRHSTRMEKALKRAEKDVRVEIVKDEGHSMLDSQNRLSMLQTIFDFVDDEIGTPTD